MEYIIKSKAELKDKKFYIECNCGDGTLLRFYRFEDYYSVEYFSQYHSFRNWHSKYSIVDLTSHDIDELIQLLASLSFINKEHANIIIKLELGGYLSFSDFGDEDISINYFNNERALNKKKSRWDILIHSSNIIRLLGNLEELLKD